MLETGLTPVFTVLSPERYASKHDALIQCWIKIVLESKAVGHYYIQIGLMFVLAVIYSPAPCYLHIPNSGATV